jgi:formylglycine-generating enzyme required for sulfatase activity
MIEPEMIVIPARVFRMGCERGAENERPVHRVSLDQFAIGRSAVTNREYRLFVLETEHPAPKNWTDSQFNHPDQPVVGVSWFDATKYCDWLSHKSNKLYRLPTEAEWERAARGLLEDKLYTWGDEPPDLQPKYDLLWINGPERVGQRPPNTFNLYDISENIHEWCSDWFDKDFYSSSPFHNPQGPTAGTRRASRGGSWRHKIKIARVSARSSIPPDFRYDDYGFRCAM